MLPVSTCVCYRNTTRNILLNLRLFLIDGRTSISVDITYCFPGALDSYVARVIHNISLELSTTRIIHHSDHTSFKNKLSQLRLLGPKRASKLGRSLTKEKE